MGNKSKKSLAELNADLKLPQLMKATEMVTTLGGFKNKMQNSWQDNSDNIACGDIIPQ